MSEPRASCFIRGCSDQVSGTGVRTLHPLCERHLAQDRHRVRDLQKSVQKKLEPLLAKHKNFRMKQQALAFELQEAEELFDSAVESMMKWKTAVMKRLTERHDSVMQNLRQLSVLQDYDRELKEAERSNDFTKIFELSGAIDLECDDVQDLGESAEDSPGAARTVGDVSGGLRDLQLLLDMQLSDVMQLCESADPVMEKNICEFQSKINNLPGSPYFVSSCSNTQGFYVDSEGKVVKVESPADELQSLPQRCLFISFHPDSKIDHLLACSVDGSVNARVECDRDFSKAIAGLSCDSKRQALYIAQFDSVKVVDLSGCLLHVINRQSVGENFEIWGVTCSSDKILAISKSKATREVFCFDKDSGQLQSRVALNGACPTAEFFECVSEADNALLITDWNAGRLYKFCIASGQLISTYPTQRSLVDELHRPSGVVAHRSGLIFVGESSRHVVRVMRNDGTVLQTLGVEDQAGSGGGLLNCPFDLTVVEGEPDLLAVLQDGDEKSIIIFQIRKFSIS